MRSSSLSAFLLVGCLASTFALGCASSASEAGADEGDQGALRTDGAISLHLTIDESKQVFTSHIASFAVKDANVELPCRERDFGISSKPSLYAGWSPDQAAEFSESVPGSQYRSYALASCRDAKTEITAWFGKERDIELSVSDQLINDRYDASRLPLLLRRTEVGSSQAKYFSCEGAFQKTQVAENATSKRFDVSVECKARNAPSKEALGPLDFLAEPGAFAALASYRPWALPSVPSDQATFARVRESLIDHVGEGNYTGAMSTLTRGCDLKVEKTADGLVVDHVIQSSNRKRHLELKAENLIGFTEGELFADPIRIDGPSQGRFAAAEFRDGKGGSVVLRFEKSTSLDAQTVRINGPEAYCRRLVKH